MQCPKCGTWATEYDEGKWQCLSHRCGIKFLYEKPVAPAPTVNNTYIHTEAGAVLQDLDVASKQCHVPVYGKVGGWGMKELLQMSGVIAFLAIAPWALLVSIYVSGWIWISVIIGVIVICVMIFIHRVQKRKANENIVVARRVHCPHCLAQAGFLNLGFEDQILRCKNCGKSFYVDSEASYPLTHR
jgi:ribosomal protein L37AE/L43A